LRLPLPYLPLQILWINLATDSLPALSLGGEKGSKGLMKQKPRPVNESIFHNIKGLMIVTSIIAVIVTMIGFIAGLQMDIEAGINSYDITVPSYARTLALTTLIVFELFFVFNCREEGKTAFELNPFTNMTLIFAVIASLLLHMAIMYTDSLLHYFGYVNVQIFTPVLQLVPVPIETWGLIFILGVTGLFTPYIDRGIQKLLPKRK